MQPPFPQLQTLASQAACMTGYHMCPLVGSDFIWIQISLAASCILIGSHIPDQACAKDAAQKFIFRAVNIAYNLHMTDCQ